ncbi:sensor histidine kinase [Halopseudomonas sabulinigri]|uniref:histidine kinase n=1 Tax=Halopseudomonas sabulinigri TaxID=472181 RepID=A0ABP9ZSB1_9GAMM
MPGPRSLFWRLVLLVAGFCLSLIWATNYLSTRIDQYVSHLPEASLRELRGYASEAAAAAAAGPDALRGWQTNNAVLSPELLVVLDADREPLPGQQLSDTQRDRLSFVRGYDRPMSMRGDGRPMIAVPMPGEAQLVLRLPAHLTPWGQRVWLNALLLYLVPGLLSVLFCVLLYMLLISPLERLRRQATAMQADPLQNLLSPALARRRDELGELGRALDYLTRRLRQSIAQQRQLLRDVSHELRTPLSRLRVAAESELSVLELRERLERECAVMQTLVDGTLELAWLDSEPGQLPCEAIDVNALWEVLREDALFESGWTADRICSQVPAACRVHGHLNGLAQALENVLRNAIRHSPPGGRVSLCAERDGAHWVLCIADQGSGVAPEHLQLIFRPFARLNAARPGGDGFGLGLAIAEGQIRLQQGRLWAENGAPGLRIKLRLQAV